MFPGTEGYEEQAASLVPRYEAIAFEDKYRREMGLMPGSPCQILDIGAGTGGDAAWLAAQGHNVMAVEPVATLRLAGRALHPSSNIEWVGDGLPDLRGVVERRRQFDIILLTAVWMHLDRCQRKAAMPVVAGLLGPGGVLFMSLRHGPVPAGRRMFDVTAEETIELGTAHGLTLLLNERVESAQPENRAAGVEWTKLAFQSSGQGLARGVRSPNTC